MNCDTIKVTELYYNFRPIISMSGYNDQSVHKYYAHGKKSVTEYSTESNVEPYQENKNKKGHHPKRNSFKKKYDSRSIVCTKELLTYIYTDVFENRFSIGEREPAL
mmetsp:Transcript_37427/g.87284  ORF Transcript_37427/g.87284 Transcript_37427/m.87284 type:complete len:106 (+) Transcript_37427:438-755(+)